MSVFPGQFSPIPGSFEALPVGHSAAVGLTVPAGAKAAIVQVTTADVNWRDDGVDPTADANGGMVLHIEGVTNGVITVFTGNLHTIKFISTKTGGSTLLVSYYG